MACDSVILGKIVTLDTDFMYAQAMACRDGKIVYIGTKDVAMRLCDKSTKVYDYGDNFVYPGFWDCHTHGVMAGQRMGFMPDMQDAKSIPECVEIMREYVAKNPDRPFYLGSGWDKFEEPNASMLDAICPDKPMALKSVCCHMAWLNTAAMKALGFDAEKAKKIGPNKVHVDSNGNPTGFFAEDIVLDIFDAFAPSIEDLKEGILLWQDFAFKHGMTSVVEAMIDMYKGGLEAYAELAQEGKLKLRTYAYITIREMVAEKPKEVALYLEELVKKYNSEYFKIKGFKIFMDGVVDAGTADLIEEYNDRPGHHGMSHLTGRAQVLTDVVKSINAKGIPVHVHAIGDAAVRNAVNIFEESQFECGNFNLRNAISHIELASPEDIEKMGKLNIIPVVAPLWVNKDPVFFEHEVQKLGEERAYNAYPIKSFEKAGATICFHTDYPVTLKVDIPVEIYQAVKRGAPGMGPKSVRNADEGISVLRSILALTINGAFAVGQEHNLGTLETGKIANAVVYDTNFLECDVEDIPKGKLLATIIDGEPVYTA